MVNGRPLRSEALNKKEDKMITIALCVAWIAVTGLVLIARADYRKPRSTR